MGGVEGSQDLILCCEGEVGARKVSPTQIVSSSDVHCLVGDLEAEPKREACRRGSSGQGGRGQDRMERCGGRRGGEDLRETSFRMITSRASARGPF